MQQILPWYPKFCKAMPVLFVYGASSVTKLWFLVWALMTLWGLLPLLLICCPKAHTCGLPVISFQVLFLRAKPKVRYLGPSKSQSEFSPLSVISIYLLLQPNLSLLLTSPTALIHFPISCHLLCVPLPPLHLLKGYIPSLNISHMSLKPFPDVRNIENNMHHLPGATRIVERLTHLILTDPVNSIPCCLVSQMSTLKHSMFTHPGFHYWCKQVGGHRLPPLLRQIHFLPLNSEGLTSAMPICDHL